MGQLEQLGFKRMGAPTDGPDLAEVTFWSHEGAVERKNVSRGEVLIGAFSTHDADSARYDFTGLGIDGVVF
jgi:hypothetical protein